MNSAIRFLIAFLIANATSFTTAQAQATVKLTEAQAAALNDTVKNVVREQGVLLSAATVELRSPFDGTIVFLVEKGTRVKKGDLLVRLDSSAIENAISKQKSELAAREADVVATENALNNRELSLKNSRVVGEKQVEVAKMKLDLFRVEDGEFDAAQKNLADRMLVVENQVAAAAATLDQVKEREAANSAAVKGAEATLAAAKAESSVLRREQKLHNLRKQVHLTELELVLLEHQSNLDAMSNALRTELQQAKADVQAARIANDLEQSKLDALIEKLDGSVVHAPRDGVVLYPETRRGAAMLEAGATVRERQTLLTVADVTKLEVAVLVNETRIHRVQVGQNAVIQFDALVDRDFQGTVERINDTPEATTFLQESGREYKVIVSVRDPVPLLRVGMTAMVDIRTNK